MRLLVTEADAAIAKAQAMLNAIGQANQVVTPCDCLVYSTANEKRRGGRSGHTDLHPPPRKCSAGGDGPVAG